MCRRPVGEGKKNPPSDLFLRYRHIMVFFRLRIICLIKLGIQNIFMFVYFKNICRGQVLLGDKLVFSFRYYCTMIFFSNLFFFCSWHFVVDAHGLGKRLI